MKRLKKPYRKITRRIYSLPDAEVKIPAFPSEPSEPEKPGILVVAGPMAGSMVLSLGMLLFYHNSLYPLIMICGSMVYASVTLLRFRERRRKYLREIQNLREVYGRRLFELEDTCRGLVSKQREVLLHNHPAAEEVEAWSHLSEGRLWERRTNDPDFLDLRLGLGKTCTSFSIIAPGIEFPELADPAYLRSKILNEEYSFVDEIPVSVFLKDHPLLAVAGSQEIRAAFLRSLLCQAAGLHAPSDLTLAMICNHRTARSWEWVKWLPHCGALSDGLPRIAYDQETGWALLTRLLDECRNPRQPHMLLIVDEADYLRESELFRSIRDRPKEIRIALIYLSAHPAHIPRDFGAVIELLDEHRAVLRRSIHAEELLFQQDRLEADRAEMICRRLASLCDYEASLNSDLPDSIRLMDLMGTSLQSLDLRSRWEKQILSAPELRTVVGMRAGDRPLMLNLKQSDAGPHGLIAGTTGSGKSELLLTLLTGLAMNHHPYQVQFLLVDYKGGTAMSVLRGFPHTIGLVTDLDGRQTLRTLKMLASEMQRREQVLTDARVADIDKYHQAGLKNPFPYLFVIIDEFAELRDRFQNDLENVMDQFISVAQKGRALGVHLIIAMQKPEGVVNDRIRANMKFRICLRVERAEDSRNVIGTADAFLLPAHPPGRAYYRVGNFDDYEQFQVARIAGEFREDGSSIAVQDSTIYEICPDGTRVPLIHDESHHGEVQEGDRARLTEAEVVVRLASEAAAAMDLHPLPGPWMEPLPELVGLQQLIDRFNKGEKGSCVQRKAESGVPVGMIDDPGSQQQLLLTFSPDQGNLLVVGAPGSGRTTLVQTLVYSLACDFQPAELHVHLVDFAGHKLMASFSHFPHVGGVYEPADNERIIKLLNSLRSALEKRRKQFLDEMAADLAGFNSVVGEEEKLPHILVVIHNYEKFRQEFVNDIPDWIHLMREGLAYGIVFVVTSDRSPSSQVLELIRKRIVLSVADRSLYAMLLGGRLSSRNGLDLPGRGYTSGVGEASTRDLLEIQIASPLSGPEAGWIPGLNEIGKRMADQWKGSLPQKIRSLPLKISVSEIVQQCQGSSQAGHETVVLGIDGNMEPVFLDFDRIPRTFLICGPPESGKTVLLHTLLRGLALSMPEHGRSIMVLSHSKGLKASDVERDSAEKIFWADRREDWSSTASDFMDRLEQEAVRGTEETRFFLIVDDLHLVSNELFSKYGTKLSRFLSPDEAQPFWMFVSLPVLAIHNSDPLIRRFRTGMAGVWLVSTEPGEAVQVGVKLPGRLRGMELPPGRGIYYDASGQKLFQAALPGECPHND